MPCPPQIGAAWRCSSPNIPPATAASSCPTANSARTMAPDQKLFGVIDRAIMVEQERLAKR